MRRIALLSSLLLLVCAAARRDGWMSVDVQGRQRRALVHAVSGHKLPLVVVFHGGDDSPVNMARVSRFDELADREHFVVVYPEGVEKGWNDGRGVTRAAKLGVDDIEFTRRLVAQLRQRYDIDPQRIYATGPSNGGIFANRLGCEMADTFAAIGPVIGTLPVVLRDSCKPAAPVAVVGVQGTADPLVPFEGGAVMASRDAQELWARLDGCERGPDVAALPVKVNDGTSVTRRAWSQCRGGAEVVWYEVAGGGHRWYGRQAERPAVESFVEKHLGKTSMNIDTTKVVWAELKKHKRTMNDER